MRNKDLLILGIFLFAACSKHPGKKELFDIHPDGYKSFRMNMIQLDSIKMEDVISSFKGEICISKSDIYFVDQKLCWVFRFDTTGKLIQRSIGQGKGPNELPTTSVQFFTPLSNGGFFIIGPSWDCYIFDSGFRRVDDYEINWNSHLSKNEVMTQPDASEPTIYSLNYGVGEIKNDGDMIYMPVSAQNSLFNPLTTSYPTEARIFASMYIKNGSVINLFGRLSPVYLHNKNVSPFYYTFYDLMPHGEMIITYPPDSLIYIFDRDFTLKKAFGFRGRDMDQNYRAERNFSDFKKNIQVESKEKGYYRAIKYIPDRRLCFRSYQKSGRAANDGLQIYKEDTLIADIDVPKGFSVKGYIPPYFYSNVFLNDEAGSIKVYKFKIPY